MSKELKEILTEFVQVTLAFQNRMAPGMRNPEYVRDLEYILDSLNPETTPEEKPGLSAVEFRKRLVLVAEGELGNGETVGNNRGSDITRYFGPHQDMDGQPWCAAFVSYCVHQALDIPGALDTWAVRARDFLGLDYRGKPFPPPVSLGKKHFWLEQKWPRYLPKPGSESEPTIAVGDIVVWWRGKYKDIGLGHVGIITSTTYPVTTFTTIEGNIGDFPSRVRSYTRDIGDKQLMAIMAVHPATHERTTV